MTAKFDTTTLNSQEFIQLIIEEDELYTKTNTYAKSTFGLQRVLDIFWLVHNFVRPHFTNRIVPAVAIGILEKGLSWEALLQLRIRF